MLCVFNYIMDNITSRVDYRQVSCSMYSKVCFQRHGKAEFSAYMCDGKHIGQH